MITASQLFGGSNPGDHRCYYCGVSCNVQYQVKDYVKATFTNHQDVSFPGSLYVCQGCAVSMNEFAVVHLPDGEIKGDGKKRNGTRMYSWIFNRNKKQGYTKAYIAQMRKQILNPPKPPFCIVLADSGKKQLIFRAPVSMGRDYFRVMLEEEIINVDRSNLITRLEYAEKLIAALGKPALKDYESTSHVIRCNDYWGSPELLLQWQSLRAAPLSRLAVWLARPMKGCQDEYPKPFPIPAKTSRTDQPSGQITGQTRERGREADGHQACFDFAESI